MVNRVTAAAARNLSVDLKPVLEAKRRLFTPLSLKVIAQDPSEVSVCVFFFLWLQTTAQQVCDPPVVVVVVVQRTADSPRPGDPSVQSSEWTLIRAGISSPSSNWVKMIGSPDLLAFTGTEGFEEGEVDQEVHGLPEELSVPLFPPFHPWTSSAQFHRDFILVAEFSEQVCVCV